MLLKHILFWEEKIIRDAVLDKRLTQCQVIDAIRTYDFRLVRAITAFEETLNIPDVDPELIHMHAEGDSVSSEPPSAAKSIG